MVTRWSLFALGLVVVLGASQAEAKRGKKRSKPAPAAEAEAPAAGAVDQDAAEVEPVIAILPVATKRRARSKEKRQAKALHAALTEALGQLERALQARARAEHEVTGAAQRIVVAHGRPPVAIRSSSRRRASS